MPSIQIPRPNPETPEGLAWIFSAGGIDPRPSRDRFPLLLIQAWKAQAQLYWDLGLRYHPELAVKHLKGGGQFQLAEIVDGAPPEPEPDLTDEQVAERMLDIVAKTKPEFVAKIRQLRESGTEEQRLAALKALDAERTGFQTLMTYLENNDDPVRE